MPAYISIAILLAVLSVVAAKVGTASGTGGWNNAPNTQYHIQTDEGDERYFKYQTISGQYRKEKRLQDGTVVGSYGWVDANGFLRLRDYVADNGGYRIVRTKMVFVGKDEPIGNAVTKAKSVPSQGGTGVTNLNTASAVSSSIPSTTPSTPVYSPPSSSYVPPNAISTVPSYPSSTVSPIIAPISSYPYPQPEINSNSIYPSSTPSYNDPPNNSLLPPQFIINPYRYTPVRPQYPLVDRNYQQQNYDNGQYQDIGTASNIRNYQVPYSNQQQFPLYDGVSATHNGFRYYLPRHYHEEETSAGEKKSGSFGYIDPFGIRRVVYYNSAPGTGFVHRKNNRYVGFNSTPYDPRY